MGMAESLTLIANPGSASRKYALFQGEDERALLHFEWQDERIVCTLRAGTDKHMMTTDLPNLEAASGRVEAILRSKGLLGDDEEIGQIGLRVVAPGSYFLKHRRIDEEFEKKLRSTQSLAPLHITATVGELENLRAQVGTMPVVGVSDSAFHAGKPDYAWNYGLPLDDADRFDVKRFGYHGLSASSTVRQLEKKGELPDKLIVCHLGSGVSVSAISGGNSIDTTMGYSPLEGLIMGTRSGSIDFSAVRTLKHVLDLDDEGIEHYLNKKSGLLGLGGSSDIRELLDRESKGGRRARLALATYVYAIQKAIGQMTAALGGVDAIAFTGTVGERSAVVRERIVSKLQYLGCMTDPKLNQAHTSPGGIVRIDRVSQSCPMFVVPADETTEMSLQMSTVEGL